MGIKKKAIRLWKVLTRIKKQNKTDVWVCVRRKKSVLQLDLCIFKYINKVTRSAQEVIILNHFVQLCTHKQNISHYIKVLIVVY